MPSTTEGEKENAKRRLASDREGRSTARAARTQQTGATERRRATGRALASDRGGGRVELGGGERCRWAEAEEKRTRENEGL